MALTFPTNPSDGDTYEGFTYNATKSVWNSTTGGGSSVTVSDTAPTSPSEGDMWFNSTVLKTYVYYSSTWVVVNPSGTTTGGGSSVTAYANLAAFPSSGNTIGDFGFAEDTKALYVWDGTEWDRIHSGPDHEITWDSAGEPESTIVVPLGDGTGVTVNLSATDIDGFDISYSYAITPSNQTDFEVSQNSDGSYQLIATSGASASSHTIRFTATDGVHTLNKYCTVQIAASAYSLWRLYSANSSSGGLWDMDAAGGLYLGDGTQLSTSPTMSAVQGVVLSAGYYGTFRSSTANPFTDTTSSGPWDANSGGGSFFNGGRLAWSDATGHWVGMYFSSEISLDDLSGGTVNLRTYTAGRANRCPRQILLQYYDGDLSGTYDSANWQTYATLNSNQTSGNPTWSNITEGSSITV
jgi:hypothetical protein